MRMMPGLMILLFALPVGSAPAADQPAPTALPRYHLEVGQKLRSEGFTSKRSNGLMDGNRTDVTVWVVDQVAPGCWQLLIEEQAQRMAIRWTPTADGSLPAQVPMEGVGSWAKFSTWLELQSEAWTGQATLLTARLHDDGRIEADEPNLTILNGLLETLFPRLPGDMAAAARDGWNADAPIWEFTATRQTHADGEPVVTIATRYRFDRARGLVVSSTTTGAGTQAASEVKGHRSLSATETVDAAWLTAARAEAPRYFTALDHAAALEAAMTSPDLAPAARLTAEINDARRVVTLPLLITHLDKLAEMAKFLTDYQARSASLRQRLIGSTAPGWDLKDRDGNPRSLAAERGRVVVLDFWYRGCPACVAAYPEVKQVAAHFAGRPVALFGMSIDPSPDDTQFVANSYHFPYPTLRTEGTNLATDYGAAEFGFPTLIFIDAKGVIREIVVGGETGMAADLINKVEALLAEK